MQQPGAARRVLLLKAGEAAPSVRLEVGDYDRLFVRSLGLERYRFDVVPVYRDVPPPARPDGYDAVLVTGSPLSVTERAPWMERTGAWLLEAAARGVPVLGVCFGHQLLARALGARVVRSPRGREIGSVEVELTPEGRADPLFDGLPARLTVQTTHEDVVEGLPESATVLASNAHAAVQAFAAGPHLRGVQFHPEVEPDAMASLIRARAERLEADWVARGGAARERVEGLLAGLRPSPAGARVLRNFLEHFT